MRLYAVILTSGNHADVRAETVCEPSTSNTDPYFTFKRDGIPVAKFKKEVVDGWYIEGE